MDKNQDKRKEKVINALKEGKIKDDVTFSVFQMVEDLNERLDNEIPKLLDILPRIKGDKGDKPIVGIDFVQPKDGEDGIQGDPGEPGKDGLNGTNGLNGLDGMDGIDGKDGQDGKDASVEDVARQVLETIVIPFETGETIVDKINEGDSKIKKEKVEGLADIERLAKLNAFNPTMGPSFNDLTKKIDGVSDNGTTPKLTVSVTEPKNPKLYDLWVDIA